MTPKIRGIITSLMVGGAITGGLGHQFYLGQVNNYVGISPILLITQAGISFSRIGYSHSIKQYHTVWIDSIALIANLIVLIQYLLYNL